MVRLDDDRILDASQYPYAITPGLMNGMEAYVSQNVSPHEGIVGETVPPTTTAAYVAPPTLQTGVQSAATHVVSPNNAYAHSRLLVNGSHSKKMEN